MKTTESRVAALEQSAKLLAAQPKPHTSSLSIEELQKRFNEILTRKRPERTQEEVIADLKAYALQRHADWDIRHAQS